MISSSLTRAALVTKPVSITSKITGSLSKALASNGFTSCGSWHQRRASSSKPPSPTKGSKGILERRPVSSTPSDASNSEAKPLTSKKRTKSTTVKNVPRSKSQTAFNIPSVPSTQHITPSLLGPAAFFSLHRPISITSGFPQPVTNEAFASIFAPIARSSKPQEVILTLSNTVDSMETVREGLENYKLDSMHSQGTELNSLKSEKLEELHHNDEIRRLQVNEILGQPHYFMTGKYAPLNPPQPPKPLNIFKNFDKVPTGAQETQSRIYTGVLTVEELTDSFGNVSFTAHHSTLVAQDPDSELEPPLDSHRSLRARNRLVRLARNEMLAISVKRQRKLKMKKHKYKKLMRKTRNLRRRLDRN